MDIRDGGMRPNGTGQTSNFSGGSVSGGSVSGGGIRDGGMRPNGGGQATNYGGGSVNNGGGNGGIRDGGMRANGGGQTTNYGATALARQGSTLGPSFTNAFQNASSSFPTTIEGINVAKAVAARRNMAVSSLMQPGVYNAPRATNPGVMGATEYYGAMPRVTPGAPINVGQYITPAATDLEKLRFRGATDFAASNYGITGQRVSPGASPANIVPGGYNAPEDSFAAAPAPVETRAYPTRPYSPTPSNYTPAASPAPALAAKPTTPAAPAGKPSFGARLAGFGIDGLLSAAGFGPLIGLGRLAGGYTPGSYVTNNWNSFGGGSPSAGGTASPSMGATNFGRGSVFGGRGEGGGGRDRNNRDKSDGRTDESVKPPVVKPGTPPADWLATMPAWYQEWYASQGANGGLLT